MRILMVAHVRRCSDKVPAREKKSWESDFSTFTCLKPDTQGERIQEYFVEQSMICHNG